MDLSFLGHESCSTIPHSHGNHPETTGMVSVSSLFMLFLSIQDKTSLPRGWSLSWANHTSRPRLKDFWGLMQPLLRGHSDKLMVGRTGHCLGLEICWLVANGNIRLENVKYFKGLPSSPTHCTTQWIQSLISWDVAQAKIIFLWLL